MSFESGSWRAWVLLLLVAGACAVGPFRRPPADPYATASVARGKVVYDQYCAPCHGATGLGDGPLAAEYDPPPTDLVSPGWHVSVKDIEIVIATPHYSGRLIKSRVQTGNREMPAWNEVLTPQEIDDVTAYIRSLAR
ncbi:MAG TPA: c-type cytochrome [Candidatus Binatia bacterium]